MAPLTTSFPIKRALVQTMRAYTPLKAAISGVFEGVAPEKVKYPFVVYNLVAAPYEWDWTGVMLETAFDIWAFSPNSVEANNIDALVVQAVHDVDLPVDGQTTLICRRVSDLSSDDVDEEGKKVYQVGGTYLIWTDQQPGQVVRTTASDDINSLTESVVGS